MAQMSGNVTEPDPAPGAILPFQPVEIKVEGVSKSFGEKSVLRGIDLLIQRGETVAIVGESGGGKSVLLKLMFGHLRPDGGRILVANHEAPGSPLTDLSKADDEEMDRLRRHWAVVFQKNGLYTGTVYHNIALGLFDVKGMDDAHARQRAAEMVSAVGLSPDVLDISREQLSGGMAKRVAVARALALDPVLIFYDEPTTGLDPEHAEQLQDLIQTVHSKKPEFGGRRTTVIVTHDIRLIARLQPRVVMLHDGRVFFDGSAKAFQESKSPITRPYVDMMPVLHRRRIDDR